MSLNTDNYNFLKSSQPQGVDDYSPYIDKTYQTIQDINSGVYTNNGLTLVNFDLTSIYNSSVFSDTADSYLAIPIIQSAVHTRNDTGATVAPPTAGASLMSLKSNYQHLVHQVDAVGNGKTLHGLQPLISMFNHFKLLSQVSATDLKTASTTWGMSEIPDTPNSVQWLTRAGLKADGNANAPHPGVGLCNNVPYNGTTSGLGFQTIMGANQNAGAVNEALQRRISRIVDIQNNKYNNLFGAPSANQQPTILSSSQLITEFRPFYTVANNYMYWYDVAIIPMKMLCDCMDKIGLVKKIDLKLKVYFNTGTLQIPLTVGTANDPSTVQYGAFTNSSFNQTCPFTVNLLASSAVTGGFNYSAGASTITAGCYIAKVPTSYITVTGGSVNLGTNASIHPMPACRFVYSQITLSPAFAEQYITENRNKLVVYENVIANSFNNITANGGSFNGLVQSGLRNPLGLLIVPLISSTCPTTTSAGAGTLGFSQFASPFDTCPATSSPCSIVNLAITLGNKNVLSGNNLYYTYENFIQQVSLAQTIINEVSMNVGVIDQKWWEMNRYYWVDLGRSKEADKATDRNLNMSFINNSSVPIDVLTFIVYLDKIVVDCETGVIKKD